MSDSPNKKEWNGNYEIWIIIYLFVFGLFTNAASISDYIALSDGRFGE
jgi:hypothetical protein